MTGKGRVTQSAAILQDKTVTIEEVRQLLAPFEPIAEREAADHWAIGGPTLMLAYPREARGSILVDVVDRPWPQATADPRTDPALFAAWTMSHFGPYAGPESLSRAQQQTWDWPEAAVAVQRHRSFVRVRSSYANAAGPMTPVTPDLYDSVAEMSFLTSVAVSLADASSALAYFNPNAERLCAPVALKEAWNGYSAGGVLPLDIWTNRRLFQLSGLGEWVLMDTVGMQQLDQADLEACFQADRYSPDSVATFLLNVSTYLASQGPVIADGDTTDGPGDVPWRAGAREVGALPPQRPVLRWMSLDGIPVPEPLR